jgi:hypothetical protein
VQDSVLVYRRTEFARKKEKWQEVKGADIGGRSVGPFKITRVLEF